MSGTDVEESDLLLTCVAIRQETPNAKTYSFAAARGRLPTFEPGQFLNLTFTIDGADHMRSYSLSSSALQSERLSITVKRVPGGLVSNWLFDRMQPGGKLRAGAPAGVFSCGRAPRKPVLLLTAGSGITPAASMMRSLADLGSDADIALVHFADRSEEMIFQDEMAHWARHLPRARIVPVMTRPPAGSGWVGVSGRISADLLKGLIPDAAHRLVLCCGPEGFMRKAEQALAMIGLPPDSFLTESFGGSVDPAGSTTHPVSGDAAQAFRLEFAKSGKVIQSDAAVTVLRAAKAAEVRIQSSCGKGICGTCRVRLLSGSVDLDHKGGIRQREIDQGYILACCSRPRSDLVIDR